jgi:hypothetical protein
MDDTNVIRGTPTPVLLRAMPWHWKFIKGPFALDVPYNVSLTSDTSTEVRTVSLNVDDDVDVHLDFGALLKTLFSKTLYPSLEDKQVFSINDILLDHKNKKITIIGNVVEQTEG